MRKNMFIADIIEIDDSFIGLICYGKLSQIRFEEDSFGNFAIIEDDGCWIMKNKNISWQNLKRVFIKSILFIMSMKFVKY